jgi:hypothetical protein
VCLSAKDIVRLPLVALVPLVALMLLLSALPVAAQSPPASYGTITDRNVYPYPPLPALGAAGYQFTDPTFGSKMLRVTDANTRPDHLGREWLSPSSAETSAWNTNSTRFYVLGGGGETVPYNFDPATMTASRMGNTANGSGGLVLGFSGEPSFSFVDPDLIYGTSNTQIVSYRFSTGVQQALHDEAACLPGIVTHGGRGISVTKDDQRLLDYIGGTVQNADTYVYVYDRTLGCRWLNTQTGQVGGQWGPAGGYVGDSNFTIHNARISKNGKWVRITKGGGSGGPADVYFWSVETLDVIACNDNASPFCGGHMVTGFDLVINQRSLGDGMDFAIRPMGNVTAATALINPLLTPTQFADDTHPSWNNVQADEKQPMCTSAYRTDNIVQRAWDGEIICVETDGLGSTVWRFAHHRSDYLSFYDSPRANVSQDGRLALFTSNWGQTLGTGPDGLRQDAFIVQLASPDSVAPAAPTNLVVQ